MNEEIFQKVVDMILPYLPIGWKKMILYVGYTAGSYTMKYYSKDSNGEISDCFSQKNINKTQLIRLFMSIEKVLGTERNNLSDKNKWSVMTLVVCNDGKMSTEFDYTDISENAIDYEHSWKEKYIL